MSEQIPRKVKKPQRKSQRKPRGKLKRVRYSTVHILSQMVVLKLRMKIRSADLADEIKDLVKE
jgi:hypothetical protein